MRHRKLAWRRDTALYAAIAFLTGWQAWHFVWGKEALLTSVLAALIAIKAKLSNGHPGKPQDVTVVNSPSDPVPVDAGASGV